MRKYLVTGGSGFIGSNLVKRLVDDGKKVYLVLEANADLWRLKDIIDKVKIYYISLIEFDKITSLVKSIKPDVIFHLAAYGGLPYQKTPKKIFDVNFYGTVNLLNSCKQVGFDCFINTGSSSEYGMKDCAMSEDDVLEPVSDYGVSKAAATQFCLKEALFNKLPVYTVRPFSVYGDFEMSGRLIPSICINVLQNKPVNLSSPGFVRDFIYVEGVVDFYMLLHEKRPQDFFIFNVGTGVQATIADVMNIITALRPEKITVNWGTNIARPWEPEVWKADISRAKNILGWSPKYSLSEGLEKSLLWFEKNLHVYKKKDVGNEKRQSKYKSANV